MLQKIKGNGTILIKIKVNESSNKGDAIIKWIIIIIRITVQHSKTSKIMIKNYKIR